MFAIRRRRRPGGEGIIGGNVNPFNLFGVQIDYAAGTAIGGTQPYGSNSNDGRLWRDGTNSVASFCPPNADGTGTLVSVSSSGLRRTTAGVWHYPSLTNRALWNRDLTNAAWVSGGGGVTTAKNQTGADGAANAATLLTASGANGTLIQSITLASGQVVLSMDIKRVTGSGNIDITVDNGATWTTISGLTTSYQQKFMTQAAVTNPQIGFRIVTSGDQIAVDFVHLITPANSMNVPKAERVATTSATVLNTQSRPTADGTDVSPQTLILTFRQPFAFYWEGTSQRGAGAGFLTGIDTTFASIITNNAVSFASGSGTAQTPDGVFNVGAGVINKIAGCFDGSGVIRVSCNGQHGASTGATANATLDHLDESTNGAGTRATYGVTRKGFYQAGRMFSLAQLDFMTT